MSDQDASIQNAAINVMVSGIAFQVASLAIFLAACIEFSLRLRRAKEQDFNPRFAHVRKSRWFRAWMGVLALSTLTIFTRSVFRCAELKDGFQGPLANDQVTFMVLEGAMVASAVVLMTVVHPGIACQGTWNTAIWHVRKKNEVKAGVEMQLDEQGGRSAEVGEVR
jgi:RTA1 like protein